MYYFCAKVQFFIVANTIGVLKFFLQEEWKGKYSIAGAFLYIFTAVLITFLAFPEMSNQHFAAIFWIVVIFTTLQGISRAFIGMRKGSFVFWQQLTTPASFLAARLISAFLLMLVFTLFTFGIFILMHGDPEGNSPGFLAVCIVTGLGISSLFTISSSIAAKTDNPGMLLPVLTFPVLLPVLLIGIKAGNKVIAGMQTADIAFELLILILLDALVIAMGLVLIRFIWKE